MGTPTQTWADLKTVKSSVKYGSGTKKNVPDQEGSLHLYQVTFVFRYFIGFSYSCRIKFEGSIFNIKSIERLRRKEGFKVICERRESDA